MNNLINKTASVTLALSMVFSGISVPNTLNIKADEAKNNQIKSEEKVEVVEEVLEDRKTDSTTFLLSNGMKRTTYYSDDIYFGNKKVKSYKLKY